MKTTIKHLLDYNNASALWLMKEKENANTKLGYAIQRMAERYNKAIKPYTDLINKANEDIEDLRQDHQKEENGKLVWDMVKDGTKEIRERAYSRSDAKILTTKIRQVNTKLDADLEAIMDKEVEIEHRYATSIPANLTDFEKECFSGIVIDPEMLKQNACIQLNGHNVEQPVAH